MASALARRPPRSASLNRSVALTASVAAGAAELSLNTAAFRGGELVLIHQSSIAVSAADSSFGRYALRRVTEVHVGRLVLDAPLEAGFEAPGAQAVVVAETGDLTITADGGVDAAPWDGARGGVVALFVNGALTLDGVVTASGRGFRGGPEVAVSNDVSQCSALLEGTVDDGCAPTGEGQRQRAWGVFAGLRNDGNGGGGGGVLRGGGGGGANGGVGGRGGSGASSPGSAGPGMGGAATRGDLLEALTFGGGGGAGHAQGSAARGGGSGGGIVFIRARSLSGRGVISANGSAGRLGQGTGGSGGGAGGSIILQLGSAGTCGLVQAEGGPGGDYDTPGSGCVIANFGGPGGGGGGGRVLLAPLSSACPTSAVNGLTGLLNSCSRDSRGATPTTVDAAHSGTVETSVNAFAPMTPDAGTGGMNRSLHVGCQTSATGAALVGVLVLIAASARRRR